MRSELEQVIDSLSAMPKTSTLRLRLLADFIKELLARNGLPGTDGGSSGSRLVDPERIEREGEVFIRSLLCELKLREPAIRFTRDLDCDRNTGLDWSRGRRPSDAVESPVDKARLKG